MTECACSEEHLPRRIVLTGGPGAGKTAVLEMMKKTLCKHVVVVPEAASVVFSGGFPRIDALEARRAGQRASLLVQRELEAAIMAERRLETRTCLPADALLGRDRARDSERAARPARVTLPNTTSGAPYFTQTR